jgi:hypothetical protein
MYYKNTISMSTDDEYARRYNINNNDTPRNFVNGGGAHTAIIQSNLNNTLGDVLLVIVAVVGEEVERGQEAVCWWLAGPWDGI